ncbi:MAG: hypothetical protein WCO84_00935 [bacterium]
MDKMNYCNRGNMNIIIAILENAKTRYNFTIENIYLDLGAGMMWETITATPKNPKDWGYQILNPREWQAIQLADTNKELLEIAEEIIRDQANLFYK